MTTTNERAVREGVTSALLAVFDAAGYYPMSRRDLFDAIQDGTREAFAAHLSQDGTTTTDTKSRRWGPWRLDVSNRCVYNPQSRDDYPVNLDRCRSSAQVLDWIAQVSGKAWGDDACIAGLVRALNDIIHLQGSVCGSGVDKTITVDVVEARVKRANERWGSDE